MTGKHEPPFSTTLFRLATATLRAALVAAALVVGLFVLSRAFPQQETPVPQATGGGGPPTTPPQETSPPSDQGTTPAPDKPSPDVEGVRLAVLNGTSETGLAAATVDRLKERGYRVDGEDIGNAQSSYEVTTLFFRRDSRLEARHLRDTVFEGAKLEPATAGLDPDVRITVALGQDWADRCC